MLSTKVPAALLLLLPTAIGAQSAAAPVRTGALSELAAQAGAVVAAPDAPPSAPAAAGARFCTTNLYTYQDQPVAGYELNCTNAALGLALHHATIYDAAALFAPGGRCSPKNDSRISLTSREIRPFQIDHATDADGAPAGRRELTLYRDAPGLKPGEFLLNLTWSQGGDSYRLGFIPETGGTPTRVFKPAADKSASGAFVLKAAAVPFTFSTAKTFNGRAPAYDAVPVDCELTISVDGWYGR
jgi:hypothetical protein